jgi:tetratricopeptide (TPR) repeat protein
MPTDRVVRVFISSTFRDFERERDLVMRRVFPELRRRSAERGIEVIGIDLRWGITPEQAERGETLPICLSEIERCRPFFLALLGDRYGWTPGADAYTEALLETQPWLREHLEGCSVTELEIIHGVINRPDMVGRAVFLVRSSDWSAANGFGSASDRERAQVRALRARLGQAGHSPIECADPEAIAEQALESLWSAIDREFPAGDMPGPAELESRTHAAFARSRTRLFVGRDREVSRVAGVGSVPGGGCLVASESGLGKSAVLASAAQRCASAGDAVFEHYPGASSAASSLHAVLARLHAWIGRRLGEGPGLASEDDRRDDETLAASLPERLSELDRAMSAAGTRATIVIDALDRVAMEPHMPWLPAVLPPRVRLVMASTDPRHHGPAGRLGLEVLELAPLDRAEARALLASVLAHHRKRMPSECEAAILGHPLASTPIFLATVVGELCVSATHDSLSERVRLACSSTTVADAIMQVIRRVSGDLPDLPVFGVLASIRCSRDGLTEGELRGACSMTPSGWARIRSACEDLLHESDGRIRLRHAHVELACDAACMPSEDARRACHSALADWWLSQGPSTRAAFDMPTQLVGAGRTEDLRRVLSGAEWMASVLGTRPEAELLRLLNAAGMDTPSQVEHALAEQWPGWSEGLDDPARGSFAQSLGGFVGFVTNGSPLAVRLLSESLEIARRIDPDPAAIAIRLNNLGHELLAVRRPGEAVAAFAECLEIRTRILAPDHPHLMATFDNLGQAHASAGDLQAGIGFIRRALELRRGALGDAHPDTCTSKNNLAMTLLSAEAPGEAGPLLEESYTDSLARLGPDHPDSGIAAGNLGSWHAHHGDPVRARALLAEALDVHRRSLGTSHPYVAIGHARLSELDVVEAIRLRESGQLDAAAGRLEALLDMRIAEHGRESSEAATVHSALGETLARMGRIPGARRHLGLALEIRTRLLGVGDPATERVRRRIESLPGA